MYEKISFLKPNINQIRHSIRDIDDSYNNPWDILAELCQNSVDAIRQREIPEGKIYLKIDTSQNEIIIRDNGIGIDPKELFELLKPFSTNKNNCNHVVGEKGVGLKFVLFSCNDFIIKSRNENGAKSARILDAEIWKNKNDLEELYLQEINDHLEIIGTEITVKKICNDIEIFDLNFNQIIFILRTKTALGSTLNLIDKDIKIDIDLEFITKEGKCLKDKIPFKYFGIEEFLGENDKITLDEFVNYANSADKSDADKRRKLQDKVIIDKNTITHNNNREISYICYFVPQRSVWNDLSIEGKLCTKEQIDNDDWIDQYGYSKFESGITTSVKGMPTGILLTPPSTGVSGYWFNIFLLFEDKNIKFDIGRKSIHGKQASIYRTYAAEIFKKFTKYVTKYAAGDIHRFDPSEYDKSEILEEINELPLLKSPKIKWLKSPIDQEASIAGIFFECIGNGLLSEIIPIVSGYRRRYDLYAKYGKKTVVIEFKSRLRNILKDFKEEKKMFDEIDWIVCWDVNEDDKKEMHRRGLDLSEISQTKFGNMSNKIPDFVTHTLTINYANPIYIIDLKKIIF